MLDSLQDGTKTHTIRKYNPIRVEQMARHGLHIYWKQRRLISRDSKEPHFLFKSWFVKGQLLEFDEMWRPSDKGRIYVEPNPEENPTPLHVSLWPEAVVMTETEANALAQKDGFKSVYQMAAAFREMYGDDHGGIWIGITFTPPGDNPYGE
jgi:hypothetical protein